MNVGVFGAGAVGAYVGGRLIASGVTTTLLARPALAQAIARDGLRVSDERGFDVTLPAARVQAATAATALAACDVVFVAVKATASAAAAAALAPVLRPDAVVVSLQNGVRNVEILRATLDRHSVVAGMVAFNVQRRGPACFHQATSGGLAVAATPSSPPLVDVLARAGMPTRAHDDMTSVLWGKLLLNLNNPVNALSGLPLRDELGQRGYRRVVAACVREGLAVLARAGITPRIDAPLPPRLIPGLLSLPDPLFRLLARPMIAIGPEARSSMQEDLQQRRPTEIDLLNGELVTLGASAGVKTPFNSRIVELIKLAEKIEMPSLSADELQQKCLFPERRYF
jgi:2-dehydropantoate 2-reductase